MPHCGCAMLLPSFKNPHRRQISANGNGFRVVRQIGHFRQHRTIPALRLNHRSGSCGTASALPKCSIMSGCGTRIVLRGQKPRTLRPLPLLRFAASATGALTFAASKYYLRFWLTSCALARRIGAQLCGIAFIFSVCKMLQRLLRRHNDNCYRKNPSQPRPALGSTCINSVKFILFSPFV